MAKDPAYSELRGRLLSPEDVRVYPMHDEAGMLWGHVRIEYVPPGLISVQARRLDATEFRDVFKLKLLGGHLAYGTYKATATPPKHEG
jgi:hypothetical protein